MTIPNREIIVHKWLRVPYTLHMQDRQAKPTQLTVIFIHGLGSNHTVWQPIIDQLPPTTRAIAIDLLGFGASAKPNWPVYNAQLQATSVIATLLKARILGPVVIVGHSLGSLVAIEVAKRYPFLIRQLILVSPPLYHPTSPTIREKLLKRLMDATLNYPQISLALLKFHSKYPVAKNDFLVDDSNAHSFLDTVEASIANQTALQDLVDLTLPVHIIWGKLDPVVSPTNMASLQQLPHVTLQPLMASHLLTAQLRKAIVDSLHNLLPKD